MEVEFALLFLGLLQQVNGGAIGFQTDQNADLLGFLQRRVELVKTPDEEVADENIKKTGIGAQQDVEAITEGTALPRSSKT